MAAAQPNCSTLPLPANETFDSYGSGDGIIPTCWFVTRNYDLGSAPHVSSAKHHSGTASLYLYSGSIAQSHYSMAILPPMAIPSLNNTWISFQFYAASTATRLEVGICDDTSRYTRNFIPIDTLHADRPNRWQEFVVDLSSYQGTGRRIAFRLQRSLQVDNSECYIDDLRIGSCGTTEPWVNHLGSTHLTLNWESYGGGSVTVRYNDVIIPDAISPLTLTGLQPSTNYTFTVGCDESSSHSVSATTMEGNGMIPAYYEPFSGTTLPTGWRAPLEKRPLTGSGTLKMMPSPGDSCLAVLPLQETHEVNQLNLALRLKGTAATRLVVGVMSYADELESFIPVDTLSCSSAWTLRTVSFSTYADNGKYIALLALGNGTLEVDDLRVGQCLIDNIRVYGLADDRVTLAWDTLIPSSGSEVRVVWGIQGFSFPEGNSVIATSNPFTLTGLPASTTYDLYLLPNCGDTVCSYDYRQFSTFAHEVSAPYCCSFEDIGSGLPQGWVCPVGSAAGSSTSYQGSNGLRLAANSTVTLPTISNSSDTLLLEFFGNGQGSLQVGTMENPYSEFTLQSTLTGTSAWKRYMLEVVIPHGQALAFRCSNVWNIDALALHTDAVSDISVNAVTQTSAQVSWTMTHGDSAWVEYAPVATATGDFAEGTGTVVHAFDNITLSGLTASSYYAVHLRPLSDTAGSACHYLSVNLQTAASAIDLPYCENFDGSANFPTTWRRNSEYGEYPIVTTERNRSQSRSMRFSATNTQRTVALLPNTTGTSTHKTLAFWSNCSLRPSGALLIVGRLADITDLNSFQPTDTVRFPSANTWRHTLIDLGVNDSNVALMLVGGSSSETRVFVDDLCMESCVATQIRLSSFDSTSATFRWTSIGAEAIEIRVSGSGLSRRDTFYTSPAIVTGLRENLSYSFTVRTLCDCGDLGGAYYSGTTGKVSSDRSQSFSIRTRSGLVAIPYCTGFENIITGNNPSSWRISGGGTSVSDQNYHNGSRSLRANNASVLMLPTMNNVSSLTASFYVYAASEASIGEGIVQVGIVRNPDSAVATFVPIDTVAISRPGQWIRHATDFSSCPDNFHYIAIRITTAGTLYFDDFSVSTCGIGAVSVTEDGLVSWEGIHSPNKIFLEYGPKGFIQGSGFHDTLLSSPYQLQGLTVGANYDIYLTPLCGVQQGCSATKITLGNITAIPYCEDFQVAPPAGLPAEWLTGRIFNNTPCLITSNGARWMSMKGHSAATNRGIAVLPLLAVSDSLQISFSMKSARSGNARLAVGLIEDNADPNTFVPTDTLMNTEDNVWQRFSLPLSIPNGHKVALCCFSASQEVEVCIDSLSVSHARTPQINVTSARSVTLLSDRNDYYIEYGPAGFSQGNGTVLHVTSGNFPVEGLLPQSEYWIYTREDSTSLTCVPPSKFRLSAEETLPYCRNNITFSQLQLPEFNIDSVRHLHLYFTLRGGTAVEAGVMLHDGGWENLSPIDTFSLPVGTQQQLHLDLSRYSGSGRYVGFRALNNGTASIEDLVVTDCEWVTSTLRDDNSVLLKGTGTVEYGLEGFTPGSGTTVNVTDSLIIHNLQDNTVFDYYPLCPSVSTPCYSPQKWHTSSSEILPYCASFSSQIPLGWSVFNNTSSSNALRVVNSCLQMTVTHNAQVGVTLPLLNSHSVYVHLAVQLSSSSVAFVVGSDTIQFSSTEWQDLQLHTNYEGRLSLQAIGNGTVNLRRIEISECPLPTSLSVGQPGGGRVVLSWDTTEVPSPFYMEYKIKGATGDGTVVAATTPPLELQLTPDTLYYLYPKCSETEVSCRQPIEINTLKAPQPLPFCDHYEVNSFLVLPQFDVDSLNKLNLTFFAHFLHNNGRSVTLGVMSDAGDPDSFDSLTSFFSIGTRSTRCHYSFRDYYGNGRFLAIRVNGTERLYIDSLAVSTCSASGFRMEETDNDHVLIGWNQRGNPDVTIKYRPIDSSDAAFLVVTPAAPPCRIDNLLPLTDYIFIVRASCDNASCIEAETDTFYTFTPKGGTGCIDYTDLRASYVTCKYGTYANPTEHTGVIDYGYNNPDSRHTVHFDTTERDARTGNLLRTVPKGEMASVRLGNWKTGGISGAQAESIIYGMTVDAEQPPLLVLKYAAVLQDPEHAPSFQPRFRLEILNQNNVLIDSCGFADFIANPDLNWNIAPNEVLWKDWTTVGIDLSNYAGQTIFIRLTTNDCGEGSHFGYAYFTLECASKLMKVEGCSDVPDNCFTAPSGFNYQWYSNQNPSTLSDSATLCVVSDNSLTYFCRLSFIDNPACNFTMSAFAGARYPLAIIDTFVTVANCEFDLTLTDRSTISGDGITPIGTGERCETGRWILPGGITSTNPVETLHLTDTGIYNVTLIAGIADDQCIDTLHRAIHIRRLYPDAAINGVNERCLNAVPDTFRVSNVTSHLWSSGITGDMIVAPSADTTLTCYTVDTNGCRDTLHHPLHILPIYHFTDTDSICNTAPSYAWFDTVIAIDQTAGIISRMRHLYSSDGCDSLRSLRLQMMPSYDFHNYDTLCHDSSRPFYDTTLTTTGSYLHVDHTPFGCDSLLTLHLQIMPRVYAPDQRTVCDSLQWVNGITYHRSISGIIDTLPTVHFGCDSVVTLHLTVNYASHNIVTDTFCQGTEYFFRHHVATRSGYYADTLPTVHGCDSVLGIVLTCLPTPQLSITDVFDCQNAIYTITGTSDKPFCWWKTNPYDSAYFDVPFVNTLVVAPTEITSFILSTAYSADSLCLTSDTLTVSAATLPSAAMQLNPQALMATELYFSAYDLSVNASERAWYIDGILQGETTSSITRAVDEATDTTEIMLIASDGRCFDTTVALLPRLHNAIVAPNAFIPDADENNTFSFADHGIISGDIYIYNRNGMLVFRSSNIHAAWDGRDLNGNPCPVGNYVWKIRYRSQMHPTSFHEKTGSVLLIR